jgi:hypothetical protein
MTALRLRMIEDMQIRNLAPLTQTAYVQQVSLFARHFGQPPECLGRADVRAYQIYLVGDKHLAASSISVAVAALRFLYTITLKRAWCDSAWKKDPVLECAPAGGHFEFVDLTPSVGFSENGSP